MEAGGNRTVGVVEFGREGVDLLVGVEAVSVTGCDPWPSGFPRGALEQFRSRVAPPIASRHENVPSPQTLPQLRQHQERVGAAVQESVFVFDALPPGAGRQIYRYSVDADVVAAFKASERVERFQRRLATGCGAQLKCPQQSR